jgi:integrase
MAVNLESNGTYTVQARVHDWSGKRRKKTKRGFRTKTEAKTWERNYIATHEGSLSMTFDSFFDLYIETRTPQLKLNTVLEKRAVAAEALLPYFGQMRMDEIGPVDIARWQTEMSTKVCKTGRPYSPTTLRTFTSQLSAVFNHAVRVYGLPANPLLAVDRMGSKRGEEMRFWTRTEYLAFSDEVMVRPDLWIAYELLYWTGIRLGELLALTPEDFDLEAGVLHVTKSYQRLQGEDVITSPKTRRSVRDVAMPAFLVSEVADHLRLGQVAEGERVFTVSKWALENGIGTYAKRAGVKRIRVHDLRHSHVSLLIDKGFSALAIADRVGHEAVDITYRYAHLFPTRQRELADALDEERDADE